MPTCAKCTKIFPNKSNIGGKIRNLQRRKYCVDCSPFDSHNTKKIENEILVEKQCTSCKNIKLLSEFYKKTETRSYAICKQCFNKKSGENIKSRKKKILDALGKHECEKCGYSKYIEALDFHHIDPSTKVKYITPHRVGFEKALDEAKKCMVLCCRCHRELHVEQKLGEVE